MLHPIINPQSYLKDLLTYASGHIVRPVNGNVEVLTNEDWEALFHQAFQALLELEEVNIKEVPQIRICIESLRRYLGDRPLNPTETEEQLSASEATFLLASYESALLQLGTSLEELNELDTQPDEVREALAHRLGIDQARLTDLIRLPEDLSEVWLHQVFGLANTSAPGLSGEHQPAILGWQLERINTRATDLFGSDDSPDKIEWLEERTALATAQSDTLVQKVEEENLPSLRKALIMATGLTARQLGELLLIDCEYDASYRITRFWQAVLTIQQLIQSMRGQLMRDTHPFLIFNAENYLEEWKWLGTYQTWRAAMMVHLYPENLLGVSMRRDASTALLGFLQATKRNRRLNQQVVEAAVGEYQTYFEDICQLTIEASCQTIAEVPVEEGTSNRHYFYQFGQSNGRVYWSYYNLSLDGRRGLEHWQLVPGLEEAQLTEVHGAVPVITEEEEKYICLFFSYRAESSPNLLFGFTKMHLKTFAWEEEFIPLVKPTHFDRKIVVQQRNEEEVIPVVGFTADNIVTWGRLNDALSGWYGSTEEDNSADWFNINLRDLTGAAEWREVHAIVSIFNNSYIVLSKQEEFEPEQIQIVGLTALPGNQEYPVIAAGQVKGVVISPPIQGQPSHICIFTEDDARHYATTLSYSYGTGQFLRVNNRLEASLGFKKMAVHNGSGGEALTFGAGFRITYKVHGTEDNFVTDFLSINNNGALNSFGSRNSLVLPNRVDYHTLHVDANIYDRKQGIEEAFQHNEIAPKRVKDLLWEAYFHVPTRAALALQSRRNYGAAKDYLRLVYDHTLPTEERKIFYGLVLEESIVSDYERPNNWLLDPLLPHEIAAKRSNAYSRFTLFTMARCFLQEADEAFTRDTMESIASAKSLYQEVVTFLETPAINDPVGEWENDLEVPLNPFSQLLKLHAEVNLFKIHTNRNIAGDERPLGSQSESNDLFANWSSNGDFSTLLERPFIALKPTPFRYKVIIERAKQLVGIAQQIESAFLASLEKLEAAELNVLNARNDLELSKASIQLQDLRVTEATEGVRLAQLQRDRVSIQFDHYERLVQEGTSSLEESALTFMTASLAFNISAAAIFGVDSILGAISFGLFGDKANAGHAANALATASRTTASIFQTIASYERRQQEWLFQRNLSRQDMRISDQQIRISEGQVAIANQELGIANLRSAQAESVADFLLNKFLNAELYEWMSGVLEEVYSFFLQQATATAQLAAQQLQFERLEPIPAIIRSDYWQAPKEEDTDLDPSQDEPKDRRGLTGSARLSQDIFQLDQIAFQTDKRKLELTKTISLGQLSPIEFQRFKENGVFRFYSAMDYFDRDFPGHYARTIKRVQLSIIALTPPSQGIRATLSNSGISRIVLQQGKAFVTSTIKRPTESVALSAPINATGLFELQQDNSKLLPFEGIGVESAWELEMPKAANPFDYSSIADVLLTIEYTALNSDLYRQQVIEELNDVLTLDLALSFRNSFPDQWYDLNNPDLLIEPFRVRFETLASEFAPHLTDLKLHQVVLYFSRKDGTSFELSVDHLKFRPADSEEWLGADDQSLQSINGIVSTRSGSFSAWDPIIDRNQVPFGDWELSLTDTEELRDQMQSGQIEDIIFLLTYQGKVPAWPT